MSLLVISGLSGAGKSMASNTLEDVGYSCIDNLPPELLLSVSRISDVDRLAVIIDGRSKEKYDTLLQQLETLKKEGIDYHLLFLDCDPDVLLGRYKYTRRPHPLQSEEFPNLQDAIDYEIQFSSDIKERADTVIDTSHLKPGQFRKILTDCFMGEDYNGMTVKIISFGYKNGIPADADLLYDVRCLPNPYYVNELKNLSGNDKEVCDYVFSFENARRVLDMISEFVTYTLPLYIEEGKKELVVGIGCTSGHHRSVSFANALNEKLSNAKVRTVVLHRDIDKAYQ
ncbi:MAG: RNase adapter RapZ [Erysipelotrichaceae bacterium]|nr:RNase adapter RapZ [Erysipelotrichaceae bacterium]